MISTNRTALGSMALAGYIAAIAAANITTAHYGLVPVGLGLTATAGTYFAGCALFLRNVVQDAFGRRTVVAAILIGALLSALTSPSLALASGVAFGISELADTAVYTPLRDRRNWWARAVIPASLLGAVIDTFVFLDLAGFPVTTRGVAGQLVGKTWFVWVPTLIVSIYRTRRSVRRVQVSRNTIDA